MIFEDLALAPNILKALAQCGHREPTPVQAEAIPKALAGRDIIASAQTGTGKTAAFVLPALHKLVGQSNERRPGPRILVLTPTRELADQITQATRTYGKYVRMKSVAIFGGMPFGEQIRALSQSPEMIIATPGRLLDHMERGRIDLSHVEMFILDEADRMLDMGFIDDVERISDAVPDDCQTLLFAATVGSDTTKLAKGLLKNPARVQIAPEKMTLDAIEQRLYLADNLQHKNSLLRHICSDSTVTKAIIFSATKRDADSLARDLYHQGFAAAALHGDMTQNARNRTMLSMRRGKVRLLVATDVAARGIDITGISHVINFDLPRFTEDYVHRIGRTGRAGESGIAISFVARSDLQYLDRIERYIGKNLNMDVIPGLEPVRPLHRTGGNTERKSNNGRRPYSASTGGQSNGNKSGRFSKGRPFGFKEAEGKSGYSGNGNGYSKRKPAGRDRDVVVEYRSSKPGKTGRSGERKPGNKVFV